MKNADHEKCQARARRERDAAEARCQHLEAVLREAAEKCRCKGTGKYLNDYCSMCSDSTWDHECSDPVEKECHDPRCAVLRRALLPHQKSGDGAATLRAQEQERERIIPPGPQEMCECGAPYPHVISNPSPGEYIQWCSRCGSLWTGAEWAGPESGKCPMCGGDTDRIEVDIGVGVQCGPWQCMTCEWSQDSGPSALGEPRLPRGSR